MDDIERVETERYGIFVLSGLLTFIGIFAMYRHAIFSIVLAIAVGLLASGCYAARILTSRQ